MPPSLLLFVNGDSRHKIKGNKMNREMVKEAGHAKGGKSRCNNELLFPMPGWGWTA